MYWKLSDLWKREHTCLSQRNKNPIHILYMKIRASVIQSRLTSNLHYQNSTSTTIKFGQWQILRDTMKRYLKTKQTPKFSFNSNCYVQDLKPKALSSYPTLRMAAVHLEAFLKCDRQQFSLFVSFNAQPWKYFQLDVTRKQGGRGGGGGSFFQENSIFKQYCLKDGQPSSTVMATQEPLRTKLMAPQTSASQHCLGHAKECFWSIPGQQKQSLKNLQEFCI